MWNWITGANTPYLLSDEEITANVSGKDFLITGGTKGLGAGAAKGLAKHGAKVVVVGRTTPKELLEIPGISFIQADLGTVRGTIELARQLKGRTFDTAVLSTGIITRSTLTRTSEGLEEDLAISYLSRFVLINEMIKANMLVGRKRIYVFGYPGNNLKPTSVEDMNFESVKYTQIPAHMNTVVFNESLVHETARRFPEYHVYGLNPGWIQTGIRDNFHGGEGTILGKTAEAVIGFFNWSVDDYVENSLIHLLASETLANKNGVSFSQKGFDLEPRGWAKDETNRKAVWENSAKLVEKTLK